MLDTRTRHTSLRSPMTMVLQLAAVATIQCVWVRPVSDHFTCAG
jgi:hypothetical protein